jgi:CheY-like chemotaxis protein
MTAPARILIVDDSPTIRRVVDNALTAAGHEVSALPDGERALAEAAAFGPDLILLDFMMPGTNGYQVAKALAERGEVKAPVILMCTRSDQLPEQLLRPLGVVDFITKPFSPDAVVALVAHALEQHGVRALIEPTPFAGVPEEEPEDMEHNMPDLARPPLSGEGPELDDDLAAAAALSDLTRVLADALFVRGIDDADSLAGNVTNQVRQGLQTALMRELVARELGAEALRRPMPTLCGDLAAVPLPEVMQLLKFQGQTGVLEVSLGEARFEAAFRDGRIVSIRARNLRGGLRLGHYFVSRGSLSRAQLDEVLKEPGSSALGERLLEKGLIDHELLRAALGAQAEDLMYEMLRARRGVFGLRRGADLVREVPEGPGFSVDGLLLEGLRRIDEWSVIEKEVPSFEARFRRGREADEEGLSDDERRVFLALPTLGARAARDLIPDLEIRPFDVCKLLYRLIVMKRAVRVEDDAPAEASA